MRALFLACFGILFAGNAVASTFTGRVLTIRSAPSVTGNTRVSVQVIGAPTSCPYAGWYSWDLPDSSTAAKIWSAALLAAIHSERNIGINGTGQCDQYGIETIYFVDAI